MKNPIFQTFIIEVEEYLKDLNKDELEQIIIKLASLQEASKRNLFLHEIKNIKKSENHKSKIKPNLSPEALFIEIENFKTDIEKGVFYDEEKSMIAWDLEDPPSWRDYYEESDYEIDYSAEECTKITIDLLNEVYKYYQNEDFETVQKAYSLLFEIFNKEDYYEDNQSLTYGYTFRKALGDSFYNRKKLFT